MKRQYILATLCAIILIAGCSTISSVRYDYDTEADFGNLKTYDWMDEFTDMSAIDVKRWVKVQVEEAVGRLVYDGADWGWLVAGSSIGCIECDEYGEGCD